MMKGRILLNRDPVVLKMNVGCCICAVPLSVTVHFLMWHHVVINRESILWLFMLHDTDFIGKH